MRSVMKKIIAILLISSLLLLSLTGCLAEDKNKETNAPTETPTDAPVTDNALTEEPIEIPDSNDDAELSTNDPLVISLVKYLNDTLADHDMPDNSMAVKMDAIRDGRQALHIAFDSSKPYFVCAYLANALDSETIDYCHINEYVWVKYATAEEIAVDYNSLKMVVAFQVNPALFVKDIMKEDAAVPSMEHFQPYEPLFSEGVNTKTADTFDETFIYLNSSEGDTVYHSTSAYNNDWVTIPCIYLDKEYYIMQNIRTVYPDGTGYEVNINDCFDKYYNILTNFMDTEKYSVTDEKGRTTFYGLIEINDFSNCIN